MASDTAFHLNDTLALQLRQGLRRLGKAVVIITAWYDNRRWAMTATAVSELSMEPPSLLVCVNRAASMYSALTAGANFCINILSADQSNVSDAASGSMKGEARFSVGQWDKATCGTPLLYGAQANFLCRYEKHIEYGTHAIVIGEVVDVSIQGEVDPLMYADGAYARLEQKSQLSP